MTKAIKQKAARRMGRPTQEQSRELDDSIVSIALELFLEQGFEGVTMDMIAARVNITKRTLYMRYKDKGELFLAAFNNSKGEWDFEQFGAIVSKRMSLEKKLLKLADAFLQQVLNPRYIKLGRMAVSQTDNYPRQIAMSYDTSLSPRIQSVVDVLQLHKEEMDAAWVKDLSMTAELFVGLITGLPSRLASMGTIRDIKFEEKRIKRAVKIFVRGIQRCDDVKK